MSGSSSSNLKQGSNNTTDVQISAPKFTIHFRTRAEMMGRYGFDYPRDADFYPIEPVGDSSDRAKNYLPVLKSSMSSFRDVYLKDASLSTRLKQKGYLPAWLMIFPHTSSKIYAGGSDMHSQGVSLNLELHLDLGETKLIDDGTKITFKSSNASALVISPESIALSEFSAKTPATLKIDRINNRNRYHYTLSKAVLIKGVKNKLLNKHEYITVTATKNGNSHDVGVLMVHKNSVTYKAELVFVDVTASSGSQVSPADNVEWYLKYMGFNQALIRAEKVAHTKLDLFQLSQKNSDVSNFLSNYRNKQYTNILDFCNQLIAIFEKHGNHNPTQNGKKIQLNESGHKRTFVFVTDLEADRINGVAPPLSKGGKFKWGNTVIIFKQANTKNDTLTHELGHSFGLYHVFDSNAPHQFYKGWSNKIMDYAWRTQDSTTQKNTNKRLLFTRYEWYQMQNDNSIREI